MSELLERLAGTPSLTRRSEELREWLYGQFLELANTSPHFERDAVSRDYPTLFARKRLSAMPADIRSALLLTALEGFSDAEAGRIMAVNEYTARTLARKGLIELDAPRRANVLIVEASGTAEVELVKCVEQLEHNVLDVKYRI